MRSFQDRRSRTPSAPAEPRAEGLEPRRLLAVITAFTPRFSVNETGDIAIIANTLMTAPDSDVDAASARAGTGTRINDNDFAMTYVDVDSDATTFNWVGVEVVIVRETTVLKLEPSSTAAVFSA